VRPRRIAVAGGFTAGHIFPALEVLRVYRTEFGAEGYFIGCPEGMETRIVPDSGERLESIPGAPIAGQSAIGKARAVYRLARGSRRRSLAAAARRDAAGHRIRQLCVGRRLPWRRGRWGSLS
jgi:UDP-N-acetylglucosamine:LPS N-acetylglucosamine transferase